MAKSDTETVVEALRTTLRDGLAAAITALGLGSVGDGYDISDPGAGAWVVGPLVGNLDPGTDPLFWVEPISHPSVPDASGSPVHRHDDHVIRVIASVLVPDGDEQAGWRKACRYVDAFKYTLSTTPHLGLGAGDVEQGAEIRFGFSGSSTLYYNGVLDVRFRRVWTGS